VLAPVLVVVALRAGARCGDDARCFFAAGAPESVVLVGGGGAAVAAARPFLATGERLDGDGGGDGDGDGDALAARAVRFLEVGGRARGGDGDESGLA
jgi:hypothetical protein